MKREFIRICCKQLKFLHYPFRQGGQKEANVEKHGNLLKMCPFPQYPSTLPSCNTKLVQLTFSLKFCCKYNVES